MTTLALRDEMLRKSIHFSSLWIPALYFFLPKGQMLLILLVVSLAVVVADVFRHSPGKIQDLFNKYFATVLREGEKVEGKFTSATMFMLASLVTVLIFPKVIAICAVSVLVISDACAALVGKKYGTYHIIEHKTKEGSIAFFVSALAVLLTIGIVMHQNASFYVAGFVAAVVGALVEMISKPFGVDDNITIPLSVSIILWLLMY